MFESIYKTKSFCLVLSNLQPEERELLELALRTEEAKVQFWDPYFGNPSFVAGEIFIVNFSEHCLHPWRDWAIPTSIIGRLSKEGQHLARNNYLTSFWNLETNPISFYLPYINKQYLSFPRNAIIWTNNTLFNESLRSILSFFQMQAVVTNNPEVAISSLKNTKYDLAFLDWDNAGIEPLNIIKEFRKMRQLQQYLPEIIGIKDFNKMNIFKDLTSGIREFCSVLFTPQEIIELMLRSLPLERNSESRSYMDTELPVLLPGNLNDPNGRLFLDYKKENRMASLKTNHSIKEFQILTFKLQFEWLLI